MLQYLDCGLNDVWLLNGYTETETAYGPALAVQDISGLHRVIGLRIISDRPELAPEELRFLRKEMDFSQRDLATALGVSESTWRNWETARVPVDASADKLLRLLYQEWATGDAHIRELVDRLAHLNREDHNRLVFESGQSGWRNAA